MRIKLAFLILALAACQRIERGEALKTETIKSIQSLGLLDSNEQILQFYSNYSKEKAGNFYTDRRIAHYWLDEGHQERSEIAFAYYDEITAIDTTFPAQDFDIPYMTVHKKDGSAFRVYISGSKAEEQAFFENVLLAWKNSKTTCLTH